MAAGIVWDFRTSNRANPQLTPVDGTASGLDLTAAGGATSGSNGADVFTISSSPASPRILHILTVSIDQCTAGAIITLRMYMKKRSTDTALTEFYNVEFIKDNSPDLLPLISGTLAVMSNLRIEMESDNVADNNVDVDYSYIRE